MSTHSRSETENSPVPSALQNSYELQMGEIREQFPEYRFADNNELELILQMYEEHMNQPFQTNNPAFYVSGTIIFLVSSLFYNAAQLNLVNFSTLMDYSYDSHEMVT